MKHPIEWHQKCLENMRRDLGDKRADLFRAQNEYDRAYRELRLYEDQVQRAVNEGRDGFDAERFGKKRK